MPARTREEWEREQMENVPIAMMTLSVLTTLYSIHDLLVMLESIAEERVDGSTCEHRQASWQRCLNEVRVALQAVRDEQAISGAEIK